jgi:DNA-binding MarR family transcriptional regulator
MDATRQIPRSVALEVRDQCLCFAAQRAARELAKRFDRLFSELRITNGQFSMLVAIGGMGQPKLGQLADFLVMDQATATAAIKKLEARGLVTSGVDQADRRVRRVSLTAEGNALLAKAVPLWRKEHARLADELSHAEAGVIHRHLVELVTPAASRSRAST